MFFKATTRVSPKQSQEHGLHSETLASSGQAKNAPRGMLNQIAQIVMKTCCKRDILSIFLLK